MEEVFSYKDKIFNVSVDNSDKGQKVNINENSNEISVLSQDENEVVIDLDGERSKFYIASDKDNYYVFYNGRQHLFKKQLLDPFVCVFGINRVHIRPSSLFDLQEAPGRLSTADNHPAPANPSQYA